MSITRKKPAAPPALDKFISGAPDAGMAPAPALDDAEAVYKTMTLRLNKSRYERLRRLAFEQEISIASIIIEAIDKKLKNV